MLLVTSNEISEMDRLSSEEYGIPERLLMEAAGRGAARYFLELFGDKVSGNVGILAGRGNNGGDAFVVARYLRQKNIPVTVFLLSEQNKIKSDTAIANLKLLISLGISFVKVPNEIVFDKLKIDLENCTIWVDGIIGTGLKTEIGGLLLKVMKFVNKSKKPVLSIDIPSGISSDTGEICGTCIHASATITFAFAKLGHFLYPGRKYVGKLKIIDIGIPFIVAKKIGSSQELLDLRIIKKQFFPREDESHKGISGRLIVIAGSVGKTGAAVLTSLGAMRSGAGLVTLCIPEQLNSVVESMLIEGMTIGLPENSLGDIDLSSIEIIAESLKNKKCVAFGPGIGMKPGVFSILEWLLKNCRVPIVIDADGLNIIAKDVTVLENKNAPVILTPHPGEMARLTGKSVEKIQANRVSVAKDFAKKYSVYVVLKGAGTVFANPQGMIFINPTGNSGMASGGMGDVLTGILAGFISQGYSVDAAVKISVYLHGLAGDCAAYLKGPYGYLATDLIDQIPRQIATLLYSDKNDLLLEDKDLLSYIIAN